MNRKSKRVLTRFGPETRFEVIPIPADERELAEKARFEGLKRRLLFERVQTLSDPRLDSQISRAANEAAALARVTAYPTLVFPALFEEKAEALLSRGQLPEGQCGRRQELLVV